MKRCLTDDPSSSSKNSVWSSHHDSLTSSRPDYITVVYLFGRVQNSFVHRVGYHSNSNSNSNSRSGYINLLNTRYPCYAEKLMAWNHWRNSAHADESFGMDLYVQEDWILFHAVINYILHFYGYLHRNSPKRLELISTCCYPDMIHPFFQWETNIPEIQSRKMNTVMPIRLQENPQTSDPFFLITTNEDDNSVRLTPYKNFFVDVNLDHQVQEGDVSDSSSNTKGFSLCRLFRGICLRNQK